MNHYTIVLGFLVLISAFGIKDDAAQKPKQPDIAGYYTCTTSYDFTKEDEEQGHERIKPTTVVAAIYHGFNKGYYMVWTTRDGTQRGAGELKGNTFRVGISLPGGVPAYSEYQIKSVDPLVLEGTWVVQPNGGKGTEKLEFLRAIK